MYQGKFSQNAPTEPKEPVSQDPITEMVPPKRRDRSERKRKRGTILFYSIYGTFVAASIIAILCAMAPLRNWLVRYEASQPEQRASEVFEQLFKDPNWAELYTQAAAQDSAFEGKEAYAAHMEKKAENAKLTYIETSAGLSGDHKYIVRLDDEKIATFTLTGGTDSQTDISVWELGKVELFFERDQSATIERLPGHTVTVNGVALDDSYIVKSVSTKAEQYLPEGLHGYCVEQLYVDGLMSQPEIVVTDAAGNAVAMTQDAETGIWKPQVSVSATQMTDEEKALALSAAKADAAFSIRSISTTQLRKYFDSKSQVYKDITGSRSLIQNHKGYSFDESFSSVKDFYRYSDSVFSARVTLKMKVIRKNGSIKEFDVDKTYFFTKNSSGNYLVDRYTNVHVQETVEQVRLTFFKDGERLGSQMVSSTASSLTLPQITPPEGQVLQGWAVKKTEAGKITMTIVFTPGEYGVIYLSSDHALEPMALHAVFGAEEVNE